MDGVKSILGPAILLCFVSAARAQCSHPLWPFEEASRPSYGDIIRHDNGLLMIYLGPDGADYNQSMIGTLNGLGAKPQKGVADVLCRQIGYLNGYLSTRETIGDCFNKTPVWLSNIDCSSATEDLSHILRCDYDFNPDRTTWNHSHDVYLDCFEPIDTENAYDGQVILLPGDSSHPNYTRSFGMVALKQHSNLVYIREVEPLSAMEADALCRSVGFTHSLPNSAASIQRYQSVDRNKYMFTHASSAITLGINSTFIDCSMPYPCIQCCLRPGDQSEAFTYSDSHNDALLIRCTFYNSSHFISGQTCGKKDSCQLQGSLDREAEKNFEILFYVLLFFSVIVMTACVFWACSCRRREYVGEKQPLLPAYSYYSTL